MSPIPLPTFRAAETRDHAPIVAAAAVNQATSRTAKLAERMRSDRPIMPDSLTALVSVFTAEDAGAARLLHGSFHPSVATSVAERQ